MVCVTRFNPTTTGALHLGHVYTILVNEWYAREYGGQFLVRFDDTWVLERFSQANRDRVAAQMRADIEWLGIEVDGWFSQAEMMPTVHDVWRKHGFDPPPYEDPVEVPIFVSHGKQWIGYPYQPLLAAERAVFDDMMGVTHLIRGEELAPDMALQCWFHDLFGLPKPHFIFLPRLKGSRGDICKTFGGYTVAELRADGWPSDEVRYLLARGCLAAIGNGWALQNLVPEPRVAL